MPQLSTLSCVPPSRLQPYHAQSATARLGPPVLSIFGSRDPSEFVRGAETLLA